MSEQKSTVESTNGDNEDVPLTRDQLNARRVGPPVRCYLGDGTFVLLRRPTGEDYREWRRLLRTDQGELIPERFDLDEEIMLSLLLVDGSGQPMYSLTDVVDKHVFDTFAMYDLKIMKMKVMDLTGNNITNEDRAKN